MPDVSAAASWAALGEWQHFATDVVDKTYELVRSFDALSAAEGVEAPDTEPAAPAAADVEPDTEAEEEVEEPVRYYVRTSVRADGSVRTHKRPILTGPVEAYADPRSMAANAAKGKWGKSPKGKGKGKGRGKGKDKGKGASAGSNDPAPLA